MAKEAYFDHVFGMCYGNKVPAGAWTDPLDRGIGTLDATAREFVARRKADEAVITCTERWAGWILEEEPLRDKGSPCALMVVVAGQTVRPPRHDVTIYREGCARPFGGG
ncbi:hypothetical protein [Sphingomonas pituitosa]|uniref:hypothetical protein n=1 Tax=Sphingomonas pituitosa TaxID=99597 RepID=UPI0012EECA93|nr:hypothetical protein [Sphingomonas pituitosa]